MKHKLALISTNKNKFSETFIQRQIQDLPQEVVLYSEGYLPKQISTNRGLSFKNLPNSIWKTRNDLEGLKQSFKKRKIEVVLTQYGPSGVELMPICHELKIPLIVHFHGYDAYRNDVLQSYGKSYSDLFRIAKAIVVVSKDMVHQLEKLACPSNKIHFIPYGIDSNLFKPSKTLIKKTFISCGRFVEKKGHKYSLKAFKRLLIKHPETILKLIGDGPLKEELEQFVKTEKLHKNVEFLGILSPKAVAKELQSASCYIQHSITTDDNDSEGTPLSILEALSSEIPVISTKHAGIVDLIQEGKNGFLVAEKDVESMYKKMLEINNSPDLAKKMGINGRELILSNYRKERYLSDLSQLINSCLD
ncbi:MAG: glycosyltransferase family 4 protein [Flavobacteriales bacterium]|nr:glycosyltransferase family 4 protein [Flavobacteriales bacterium]